jgi:hypothetical protein
MMMKTTLLVLGLGLGGLLGACADDGGSGGAGSGNDTLPKRGERTTDPTIVSATARCSCGGEVCTGSDPQNAYIHVSVAGSDPSGHLGTCAGTLDAVMDQGSYDGGSCGLYFKTACTVGKPVTVGLTVANETGGVTTASVKLTVAAN